MNYNKHPELIKYVATKGNLYNKARKVKALFRALGVFSGFMAKFCPSRLAKGNKDRDHCKRINGLSIKKRERKEPYTPKTPDTYSFQCASAVARARAAVL